MKTHSKAPALLSMAGTMVLLASCGAVSKVSKTSADLVRKSTIKVSAISEMASNAVRPPGIKVVEVREKDLKKQPTGQEQAMAFESKRRRPWFFGGPVDFKEPTLPATGTEADGSLLPANPD